MPTIAPSALIVGAPRQPAAYGLLSVVPMRNEGDGRWQNGVRWEPDTCEPADGIGMNDCEPDGTIGLPKNLDSNTPEIGEATAFTVYGHFKCSAIGSWDEAAMRAKDHLRAREEARTEQALWTGDLGNIPNFRGANGYPAPTTIGTGAVDIRTAVGLLEAFIASSYGSLGVIHMSRTMATLAIARSVVDSRGGRLYTELGTPVIAGSGYDGSGPTGTIPANGQWIYATPAMFGFRSDIFEPSNRRGDLLDRRMNDLYAVAERTYLVGFDPCGVGAVQVGLPSPTTTGGGTTDPDPTPTPLVMMLGTVPSSPIPDGTDTTIIVQTNVAPTAEVFVWLAVNGNVLGNMGEMTQTGTLEFVYNADGTNVSPGDSAEIWATSEYDGSTVESNHITIQVI